MSVLKTGFVAAAISLTVLALTGCQTWVPEAGVTLPSAEWLLHPPQYFPPSPTFPLPREMNSMQNAYRTPPTPYPGAIPPANPPLP